MEKPKYDFNTFEEVFSEIAYAFEITGSMELWHDPGASYFNVHKLYICSNGTIQYKTDHSTFDPALWPRIELLAKVMTKDPITELLYLK